MKITLTTSHSVAETSPDHLAPWGTKHDNSRNRRFNHKLYRLFPAAAMLRVLDLGCAGGGFVKDCIDDGCLAVGLEGSDFSKKLGRAEWRTIPEYLFTCDIGKPFCVAADNEPMLFDVITSWGVLEHLPNTEDVNGVIQNIHRHLAPGGLAILCISTQHDIVEGIEYHQTVQPRQWWLDKFAAAGLIDRPEYLKYFNTQFVRGPKYLAQGTFLVVLARNGERLPAIPYERPLIRLYDRLLGSTVQRYARWALGINTRGEL